MKNTFNIRVALIIAIASTMFLSSCGDKAVEPQKPVTNEPTVPPVIVAPKETSTLSVTVEGRTITFHSDSIHAVWFTNNSYRSLSENNYWGGNKGASVFSVRATNADGWKLDLCVPRVENFSIPILNSTEVINNFVTFEGSSITNGTTTRHFYVSTNSKPQRVNARFAKLVPADQKAEAVFSGSIERTSAGQPATMLPFSATGVFNNVKNVDSIYQ